MSTRVRLAGIIGWSAVSVLIAVSLNSYWDMIALLLSGATLLTLTVPIGGRDD